MAPVTWDADGWPHVETVDGKWAVEYAMPVPAASKTLQKRGGSSGSNGTGPYSEVFSGLRELGRRWEWNHDPLAEAWSLTSRGLELRTALLSANLYLAPNTLTHRTLGPKSQATFRLDVSGMLDGDRAGVAILRDQSAYLGAHKDGGTTRLVYVDGLVLDEASKWTPTDAPGTIRAQGPEISASDTGHDLWLRVKADVRPAHWKDYRRETRKVTFWYSFDGKDFTQLGPEYGLDAKWQFFMAYRFAMFNYATETVGGRVEVKEFDLALWE